MLNPVVTVKLKAERFTKRKYDLDQRLRQVESGLRSIGLEVVRLDTQSLRWFLYFTLQSRYRFNGTFISA